MATATPSLTEGADLMSSRVVEEICAILGRRRMPQSALARALGKSPVWVSERLTGRTRIGVDDMALIAAALKVNMVDLLPSDQRVRVTGQYVTGRRDVKTLAPAPRSAGPVNGLRGPLPDKISYGVPARAAFVHTADGRATLVRPRGI